MARFLFALLAVSLQPLVGAFEQEDLRISPGPANDRAERLVVGEVAVTGAGALPPLRLSKLGFATGSPGAPGAAEQWVVLFCVDWWEPCQEIRRTFRASATQLERVLNADRLLTPAVRFAEVDCAGDKALCNEHKVEWYPTVVHFSAGERQAAWEGSGPQAVAKDQRAMVAWLHQRLGEETAPAKEALLASTSPQHASGVQTASSRFPPLMTALLGLVAWFLGSGLEMLRAVREALRLVRQGAADVLAKTKREEKQPEREEQEEVQKTRLERCLPTEWAQRRQSLEL